MYSSPVSPSLWTAIAETIGSLLSTSPVWGIITILLTTAVFLALLIGATWAIVQITKTRKQPAGTIFHEEIFTRNVLDMIKELVAFNAERDRLSRRHEHIREHAIVRDQLTLVEGAQQEVRNILLIEVTRKIQEDDLTYTGAISETPTFVKYERIIDYMLNDIFSFFRRAAKENHMVDKTESEFSNYVATKINRMFMLSKQAISFQGNDPQSIEYLHELMKQKWSEIDPVYRRLFSEMKHIASQYRTKIEKEEEDYESRWSSFITNIPDMLIKGIKG